MKFSVKVAALFVALMLMVPAAAMAAKPKKYQVTGIVTALTDDVITVTKGTGDKEEKFEIGRSADTKVTGELKEGAKVTIEYSMSAATVEVKEAKPAKDPK
jgi:hypothetical protein